MSETSDSETGSGEVGQKASEPASPSDAEPLHPKPSTPAPESKTSKTSELALRLVSSAFLIPLVLYVIHIGGLWYVALVIAFMLIAQREFYGLIEDKGAEPLVGLGLGFGLAVALIAYVGNEYHATLLMTFSLLVFMIALPGLGLSARSAIAALFLYALLPILRNTVTGIRGVDADLISAATGMGLTPRQILYRVQLPLGRVDIARAPVGNL